MLSLLCTFALADTCETLVHKKKSAPFFAAHTVNHISKISLSSKNVFQCVFHCLWGTWAAKINNRWELFKNEVCLFIQPGWRQCPRVVTGGAYITGTVWIKSEQTFWTRSEWQRTSQCAVYILEGYFYLSHSWAPYSESWGCILGTTVGGLLSLDNKFAFDLVPTCPQLSL